MADRDRAAALARDPLDLGQLGLDRAQVDPVVEEHVAAGIGDMLAARLGDADRIGAGARVQEHQAAPLQHGHDQGHAVGIGGQLRAHVVVDADIAAEAVEAGFEPARELLVVERGQERLRARPFRADRLHRHVHQELVAGLVRRRGLARQVLGIGQEGERQRAGQPVERGGVAAVHAEVVEHQGDRRPVIQGDLADRVAQPGRQHRQLLARPGQPGLGGRAEGGQVGIGRRRAAPRGAQGLGVVVGLGRPLDEMLRRGHGRGRGARAQIERRCGARGEGSHAPGLGRGRAALTGARQSGDRRAAPRQGRDQLIGRIAGIDVRLAQAREPDPAMVVRGLVGGPGQPHHDGHGQRRQCRLGCAKLARQPALGERAPAAATAAPGGPIRRHAPEKLQSRRSMGRTTSARRPAEPTAVTISRPWVGESSAGLIARYAAP